MGWLLRWTLVAVVAWLGVVADGKAQASVNIQLHHWAYETIERLVAMGVIDRAMVVPKPYSRKEAAKYVARAIKRIRANQVRVDGRERIAEPLLYRLTHEFRPELEDLGVLRSPSLPSPRIKQARGTRTSASRSSTSRSRGESRGSAEPHEARGEEQQWRDWHQDVRIGARANLEVDAFWVDKQTVRFRENRMGEYYADGGGVQTDLRAWVELTDLLALSARPKAASNDEVLGKGVNENDKNIWMQEFNAKLSLYNVAAEVGRSSMWWGPGYHGSLLMTDHAFPLNFMGRLGSDEPFRLPWVLESLGEWKVNSFWGELERNRDFPRANVFGLRVSYLSADWLELGITRLTQFGGRGSGQSFPEAVWEAYKGGINPGGDRDVNEQAMIDARVRIPHVPYLVPFPAGAQLYGEIASEDDIEPTTLAAVTGLYIPQVFRGGSTDLRVEFARTDWTKSTSGSRKAWYNHDRWVSGMRHRGFPLGHHMGTNATDVFIRTSRYLMKDLHLASHFNWQERDRDQPNHEKKYEAGTDVTWWLSNKVQLRVAYRYQRIKNPGQISSIDPFVLTFADGVTSNNHLLWTTLSVDF